MPEIGYASMPVIPTFKGLQGDLEKGSGKALTAAGISGGGKFGDSAGRSAGKRFGVSFKSAMKVGAVGGALVAAGAIAFAKDSVAEAREAQKVGALTANVIKTTGKAAKVSAKHVGDLSTKISNKTAIDDEAIQSGANLLLTFKNVRNEVGKGNKIFDQATQAAVDLSAAGFGDLSGTSKQLGKALNDPVKGITALSRAGVTFTQQQKDQIAALVKSGDTLKAQKIILGEVTSQVGGAAASQATSGEKVRVAFDNIKESVGKTLLPALEDVENAFLKKGIPALEKFVDFMDKKGIPGIRRFARKAGPIIKDVIGEARDILKEAQPYAEGFVKAFNKLPDGVKKGLGAAAVLGYGATKIPGGKTATGAGATAAKTVFGLFSRAKPLPVFVVNNGVDLPGKPKPKDKGVPPLLPLAVPYLVPLLTSGDQGPKKPTKPQSNMTAAQKGLNADLGTKGFGVDKALSSLVMDDPSKAFRIISKAAKTAGTDVDTFLNGAFPKTQAALKLTGQYAKGSGIKVKGLNDTIEGLPANASTLFNSPGLSSSIKQARTYGALLDGLDKRTVGAVIGGRQDKVDNQMGRGGVTVIHNGNIVADSPRTYLDDAQRRKRRAATDGIRSRP